MLIYWFNLDNKLLYYGVRPILNKVYLTPATATYLFNSVGAPTNTVYLW